MITIEHWPEERWPDNTLAIKASTFVRYNRKRVDPWFARYVQGQEPPNYPMPAIPIEIFIDDMGIAIYQNNGRQPKDLFEQDVWLATWDCVLEINYTKPNYPLPAIPLEVQQMQACWGYPYKMAADIWLRYTDEYNVTGEEIIWPIC